MRHARRTTLTTADVDQALRVLNIEPLYGHTAHNPPSFRRAAPFPQLPQAGAVYFVEDEELDFDAIKSHVLRLAQVRGIRFAPATDHDRLSREERRGFFARDPTARRSILHTRNAAQTSTLPVKP